VPEIGADGGGLATDPRLNKLTTDLVDLTRTDTYR
jgi:hypothetical protein